MRKKAVCAALALLLLLYASPLVPSAEASGVFATPEAVTVLVDGSPVAFTACRIGGGRYFRLRDLALAFSGTGKAFSVVWSPGENAVYLSTHETYGPTGDEFRLPGGREAAVSGVVIYVNCWETVVPVYTISGSCWIRLEDLARVLNFGLSAESGAYAADTSTGYDSPDSGGAGGYMAQLAGTWSGAPDGTGLTLLVRWDGTFEARLEAAGVCFLCAGSFTWNGNILNVLCDGGERAEFTYALMRTGADVALTVYLQDVPVVTLHRQ